MGGVTERILVGMVKSNAGTTKRKGGTPVPLSTVKYVLKLLCSVKAETTYFTTLVQGHDFETTMLMTLL